MRRFCSLALVVVPIVLLPLLPVRAATWLDMPEFPLDDPDLAGGLKSAYLAHQDGRYLEAYATIKRAILDDDPRAWFFLGWLYETGRGTQRNVASAMHAYKKSAEFGNVTAPFRRCNLLLRGTDEQQQEAAEILTKLAETRAADAGLMLGEAYALGLIGDAPSFEKAQKWWKGSADAGEARALINLSLLMEGKYGFKEQLNPDAALEHLRRASEIGNAVAMAALGSRFLNGREGLRNEEKGLKWLRHAAALNVADADLVLGDHEANQLQNFVQARTHYEAAIKHGSVAALLRLGILSQRGLGAEANLDAALKLFKQAAARGSGEGAHLAASLLLNAKSDTNQAALTAEGYRFLLAAASQRTAAQVDLALLYLSGRLGVADPVSAAAWFDRAARLNDPQAQNNLAALFESGTGVTRNLQSAFNLYRLASRRGHPAATTALGRIHERGIGMEKDRITAWALYSVAAGLKDKDGARLLGELTTTLDAIELSAARKKLDEMKKLPNPIEKKDEEATDPAEGADPAEGTTEPAEKEAGPTAEDSPSPPVPTPDNP